MTGMQTISVGETTTEPSTGDREPGHRVELPVEEILQGRGSIVGKSGSGKSNSVSVVVEELLAADYPVLIFDADGEYVSLKEEHEILHVGGDEFCEKVVGPEHAEALAELGIEQRQPIILDLSGYAEDDRDADKGEVSRDTMVDAVTSAFFSLAGRAKREYGGAPYLLVAEEIHEFVPQQGGLTAGGRKLIKVAKRGRKRGLGVIGISQRPSAVDKNFITQCDWQLWHRLTWTNDVDVLEDVHGKELGEAAPGLDPGEAFLATDWDEQIRRVQFRRRHTTDLGAAPGLEGAGRMDLKETDTSILDELDEAAERARTKEARIQQLERRLETVEEERDEWQARYEDAEYLADVSAEVTGAQLSEMVEQIGASQGAPTFETVSIEFDGEAFEVPEVIEAEVLEIREEKRELESEVGAVREQRDRLQERVDELDAELADRDPPAELVALAEDVEDLIQRHGSILDGEASGRITTLERELEEVRRERDELASQVEEEFGDVDDLLVHPAVQERIDEVAEDSHYAGEHTWAIVTALAGTEWVETGAIVPYIDLKDSTAANVLRELLASELVERRRAGQGSEYRLDRDALRSIVDAHRKRERLEAKREEIAVGRGGTGG